AVYWPDDGIHPGGCVTSCLGCYVHSVIVYGHGGVLPMCMLHPEFETLSPSEIRRTQDALWRRQWDYVKTHSAFYRRKFGKAIESEIFLDTLEKLPFTDKDELRLSQEGTYPFGDYIACAPESVSRLQVTSGTTGRA